MITLEKRQKYIELASTKRYSETQLAGILGVSVSSIRMLKKLYNTPDYDPSIERNELKEKILKNENNLSGTDLAYSLGISYSKLAKLKNELKNEKRL